jgi:cytochrome c553
MKNHVWGLLLALLLVPAAIAEPPQQGTDVQKRTTRERHFVLVADPLPQAAATEPPPAWAYGFATPLKPGETAPPPAAPAAAPAAPAAPPDTTLKHLPGSTLAFTLQQIANTFGPADWYPGDHPEMPDIVAHGNRANNVLACSLCHYPNGKGRPENAGVAGLPYDYFVQTMNDFKNGARKNADPRKANTNRMIGFAKAMTDDEIKAAAQYFSSMKWTPWIKVVETDTVPKTRIAGGMFTALEGNDKEPIAGRVIEVPVNTEGTEQLRDARSGFIAYAPVGSLKKGEALVTAGGNGKTTQCGVCHGADLTGLGPVPGIAGRSPSYIARQLYDMKAGVRSGVWTQLMKPVVAKLNNDDIVAIVAYLASRPIANATPLPGATAAANAGSAPVAASADAAPLIQQGKDLFTTYGCVDCHGANGEGTEDAPNLTEATLTADQIAKFLNKPSPDAQNKGMPNVPPTSPDLQPLVAYVMSIRRPAK